MTRPILAIVLVALACLALADDRPGPVRWDDLDWRLERSVMVSRYLFHDRQPDDPWSLYVRTMGPDETPLAELLAEFDARPAAEQTRLDDHARELLRRARLAVLDPAYRLRDAIEERRPNVLGDLADPTPGFATANATALERLADAVRHAPRLVEAWGLLAYFSDLAGDAARAARAREAFFTIWDATDQATRSNLAHLWQTSILDEAWSRRDAGRYHDCLAWLDRHADALSTEAVSPGVAPATEGLLIRGLCHAEQGHVADALAVLPSLPLMDLPSRTAAPLRSYVPVHLQENTYYQRFGSDLDPHHNPAPIWQEDPLDNLVRERRQSSYLRRWVKAWTSLRRGYEADTVRRDLGRVETELEFQPRLAWRWWQDQGVLREALGELALARVCWARAAVYRPYFLYQPTGQGQGLQHVHGLPETGQPYFLGYGTFFLSGSPWSYAANAALAAEVEVDALDRAVLTVVARRALDACIRRGLETAGARALRGRLAFLAGDYPAAQEDVEAAWNALDQRDEAPADLALMVGLSHFNASRWPDAEPWLKAFTRRAPDRAVGWLALGLNLAMEGRDEEAFEAMDRAVQLDPGNATSLYNRGLLHYRLDRRDAARSDFLAARRVWPDNPQIARMIEVVGEATRYDLAVSAAPMHMDLPEDQRRDLAEMVASSRVDRSTSELADLAAASPEDQDRLLAELERRHQANPVPGSRIRLAQALLLAGEPERVQRQLAPAWPDGLEPVEQRLLLYADRATGEQRRAVELATAASWQNRPADTELLLLGATILLEHDRRDLARVVIERGLVAEPSSLGLQELRRSLERQP